MKRVAALVLIASGALALSGCAEGFGPSVPSPSAAYVDYAAYVGEYHSTIASLRWPPGVVAPSTPPNHDSSGAYEVGAGEGDAVGYWQCAWSKTYLVNKAKDPQKAKAALAQYASVVTLPAWNRSLKDPRMRAAIQSAIEHAQHGDASQLTDLYQANCV